MGRTRKPAVVVEPCTPTGSFAPLSRPEGRCVTGAHLVRCRCGAALHQVPMGENDWTWLDGDNELAIDETPPLLREPDGWERLAQADPAMYSLLRVQVGMNALHFYHFHLPEPCADGCANPFEVPWCCGWPMHLQPRGWACRDKGTVVPVDPEATPVLRTGPFRPGPRVA